MNDDEIKEFSKYLAEHKPKWNDLKDNEKQTVSFIYSHIISSNFDQIFAMLEKLNAQVESLEVRLPSAVQELESVEDFIKKYELAIVDFSAEWCVPCYLYDAPLEKLAREDKEVAVGRIDIDKHRDDVKKWFNGAMAIPLLLSFRKGKIIQRVTGVFKGQKAFDTVKWMAQRLKVPDEEFQKTLKWAEKVAEKKNWILNPNKQIREGLIAALTHSRLTEKVGYCPCKKEKIPQNICPCRPVEGKYLGADKKIEKEKGCCYCGLFCHKDYAKKIAKALIS